MSKTSSVSRIVVGAAMAIVLGALPGVRPAAAKERPENDCLVGIQGPGASPDVSVNITAVTVSCTDGEACDADGATNGTCSFQVRGCVDIPGVSGCELRPIKKVKFITKPEKNIIQLAPSTTEPTSVCGAFIDFKVPLKKKGAKPGKRKIIATAKANVKPFGKNSDSDKITFICNPCPTDNCGGSTTTTTLPNTSCGNTDGGPERLVLTIGQTGTDLDNGWTGSSHNFILVPNGKIDGCLTGCNSGSDTQCDFFAKVGAGTGSGELFGAPLPLLASNVPVCVVSRWRDDIRGTADEATGAMSLDIKLNSEVYLTDVTSVCPQCKQGKCNSGANSGKDCTVDASIDVFISQGNKDRYDLSATCTPLKPAAATLQIDFNPLTTGTSGTLTGPTPCTAQPGEPNGLVPQPDGCAGSGCASACTGLACVSTIDNPVNPGTQICVDSKGGVSQLCCNNNTSKPCFTLANGGTVTRNGFPSPPQPALPDLTYPKHSTTGVLAATFCIPATGKSSIDQVTGLPGPGAIQLTGPADWSK